MAVRASWFGQLLLIIIGCSCYAVVVADNVPYEEKFFDQYIDHFNFASQGVNTYKQRYLIQDKWWDRGVGPIFFYTGNEGDIVDFWKNTGFMFDIAPDFAALVIFGEHRYYGKSLPFGKDSFSRANISMLSVEQALADYAILLTNLKVSLNAMNCPVIAFGGSYGGMLAAYMRLKYPSIIHGSLAASAPVKLAIPAFDTTFFFHEVTQDFQAINPQCVANVKKAFDLVMNYAKQGQTGLDILSEYFKLCKPLKSMDDVTHLLEWIRNSFTSLAMLDYPYPTDFMAPLPGYPVKLACQYLLQSSDVVVGLRNAAGLFYNGTGGKLTCFDIFTEFVACADTTGCGIGPASLAWDYQVCTEVKLTGGSNNKTDMFPSLPFTPEMKKEYCQRVWKVTPRDDWNFIQYWGTNLKSSSNIIFSNGDLDPWHGAGILQSLSKSLVAIVIKGAAHHLDLRGHNPKDPASVIEAREQEQSYIRKWVNEATEQLNKR